MELSICRLTAKENKKIINTKICNAKLSQEGEKCGHEDVMD